MTVVPSFLQMAERFNREIIGLTIPPSPTMLEDRRLAHALDHLSEEVQELKEANTVEDQADALIDLVYVALGRLVEMGLTPGPLFEEVHLRNMQKQRGEKSARPNSQGHDAVKPTGWKPPNLRQYLDVTRDDLRWLLDVKREAGDYKGEDPYEDDPGPPVITKRKPRLLVLGHARHGKDTVSEMIRDAFGYSFTSSSLFCAKEVLMPLVLRDARRTREFLAHLSRSMPDPADVHQVTQELENIQAAPYANAQECFDDRGAHRVLWYQAISHYNQPNAAALGMAIFDEHDLYCGLRSSREFHALKNAGVFDVAVWVDASHRVEPEARASCTVEPWMADYVIDNNGTFDELLVNVRVLMERILEDY